MAENNEREDGNCPKCGSSRLIEDHSKAEIICTNCGCVVKETTPDMTPEWRAFNEGQRKKRSRAGPPMTYTKHDKGLSTQIGWIGRDAKGNLISPRRRAQFARLRKWHWRSQFGRNRTRTLNHALSDSSRICSQIGLPRSAKERAAYLYRDAAKADIVRGRPAEAIIAAGIYITCVEMGIPVSLESIAKTAGVSKRMIQKVHWEILRKLRIKPPVITSEKYVPIVIRSLISEGLKQSKKVERKVRSSALKIAQAADQKRLVQASRRITVAVAATYLALKECDYDVSIGRVADAIGLSKTSVRRTAENIIRVAGDELSSFTTSHLKSKKRLKGGEK